MFLQIDVLSQDYSRNKQIYYIMRLTIVENIL